MWVADRFVAGWPKQPFPQGLSRVEARELAASIRQMAMGRDAPHERLDIAAVCRSARLDAEEARLRAAEGRLQALLLPAPGNRFTVVIDPDPPGGWDHVDAGLRRDLRRHRFRFRLCHELAHTLFFDRTGAMPRPVVPESVEQERVCDELASLMLVPEEACLALPIDASSIAELHERFDVSLEVAARSFAAAIPDVTLELRVNGGGNEGRLQWSTTPGPSPNRRRRMSTYQLRERRQLVRLSG